MLIPIVYTDGKHDMIKDFMLTRLIENEDICKFKRSSGWVFITSPEIRKAQNSAYEGHERRQQL